MIMIICVTGNFCSMPSAFTFKVNKGHFSRYDKRFAGKFSVHKHQ